MDDQDIENLYVTIQNIEWRLEIIEAKLGITDVYMNLEKAKQIIRESEV